MTFKPSVSAVSIANEMLSRLPADPIQSEDEASLEAREFRRHYKTVVAKLLERHHWGLATKRIALAAKENDRPEEWPFAYEKPSDLAYPVSIIQPNGSGWYGWVFQNYRYMMPGGGSLFAQVGNTIYSMIEAATLEYTSFDITEADFTVMFKELVVLHGAAMLAYSVTKDERKAASLMQQAEFETQRAIANDINRNRPTYGNTPTETELVRGEGVNMNYVGGRVIDPVANPANTGL